MFLYCWFCDFKVPKVSQGKVCILNMWGGKINHHSMAYSLSNICTKNYWNRTTTVKIIIGGWMVSFFFWDTVCCYFKMVLSSLKRKISYFIIFKILLETMSTYQTLVICSADNFIRKKIKTPFISSNCRYL